MIPARCTECAEWTLPTVAHVCPLELTAAQAKAANLSELAAVREARWQRDVAS